MTKTWIGCASSNFRTGRHPFVKPEAIVIHIVVGSLRSCDNTFLNPNISPHRSAHYCVGKDGRLHQYVKEEDTAFHAGNVEGAVATLVTSRPGVNPNSYTIGIEHEGMPGENWPEAQRVTNATLMAEIRDRWGIPLDLHHVILHREIRSTKSCPGIPDAMRLELIQRASALSPTRPTAPSSASVTRITDGFPKKIHVVRGVNLRTERPSIAAPSIGSLNSGAEVLVSALVRGDSPRENAWWCELGGGAAYFWSGATDAQPPT